MADDMTPDPELKDAINVIWGSLPAETDPETVPRLALVTLAGILTGGAFVMTPADISGMCNLAAEQAVSLHEGRPMRITETMHGETQFVPADVETMH